jgi:hypothetical protein
MIKFSIFLTIFICGIFIYTLETSSKKVVFDCSLINYPDAINIHKEIIEQCKQKGIWNKK